MSNFPQRMRMDIISTSDGTRSYGSLDFEMFADIERFYAVRSLDEKLEITERSTGLALAPVDGAWHTGELVVLGTDERAQGLERKGRRLWEELFGSPFPESPVERGKAER